MRTHPLPLYEGFDGGVASMLDRRERGSGDAWRRRHRIAATCAVWIWLALGWLGQSAVAAVAQNESTFGDPEQVGKEFEEILAQPEFRRLRAEKIKPTEPQEPPDWIRKLREWLANLFSATAGAFSGLGFMLQILAWTVLAAIACLIIWLVVKAVGRYRARHSLDSVDKRTYEEGESDIPPGDLPADEYLRRAVELAGEGLFREAIGQLILGAMSRTERSGLVRFRRGLTHRDYLRALRQRPQQHQAFRSIVGIYEPICFGRRPAENDHYQASLEGYETGFKEPLFADGAPAKEAA